MNMTINNDVPLRDFDGESNDDTDSETELLIRHHDGKTTTRKLNSNQQHGSLFNTPHKHQQQQNGGRNSRSAPSFLSQLFGVVGGTTTFARSTSSQPNATTKNSLHTSAANSTARFGNGSGQVRFRNERSRERYSTQSANYHTSQTVNNAAQAASNYAYQNNSSASAKSKLSSSFSLNFSPTKDRLDPGMTGSSSYQPYSDNLQMSDMETQPNILATTTTSPTATGNAVNGVLQTVIDPENGSTTVFYQKNRRKSKRRSFGNLCKTCFCG